jgi:signal transduction histidine kinase/ActR/RegA family two-component response regulator
LPDNQLHKQQATMTGADSLESLWLRIEKRMGVCPSFFRLAADDAPIANGIFDLAVFGYMDNPLPSVFKERLFVFLSRFCSVRYCVARHAAFLLGRGRIAGDADAAPLPPEAVVEVLTEPLPSPDEMNWMIEELEAIAPGEDWLDYDSHSGRLIRLACARVFLDSDHSARWCRAIRRITGPARYEQLMLLLAFVRVAHFWTSVHPELTMDEDVKILLKEQEFIAKPILEQSDDAARFQLGQRLAQEMCDLRERSALVDALQRSRDELEARVQDRTAELERRARDLARLTSELTLAEERQRRHIAQLLHDHLQQLLVAACMHLDVATPRCGTEVKESLETVRKTLSEAIAASRSLTVELSPPILHEGGLAAGLSWLARWMKERHGLSVKLDLDEQIVTEREDVRVLVFQSVRELLFNIVKHAGVTEAQVSMHRLGTAELRVTVQDRGRGMDPLRAVSGGQRAESTGSGGAGLGLLSIRERLDLLGGRLTIHSGPTGGTSVTIDAPLDGSAPPVPSIMEIAAGTVLPIIEAEATNRLRLFLVDDHALVRQGLSTLLAGQIDFQVVGEAADGVEAVERIPAVRPDVVLMDFSMPRMNGVEATRRIHKLRPATRIIGLSMYEEPDRAQAMKDAGAVAFVTKSGPSDELIETIRSVAQLQPDRQPQP